MAILETRPTPLAVQQAQALLQAWVCGDLPRLKAELDRSTYIPLAGCYAHDEQLELLKSVAGQMRTSPDLYAERTTDPQLGLCVDLLMHLASCSRAAVSC
jgi:hypothetical protein